MRTASPKCDCPAVRDDYGQRLVSHSLVCLAVQRGGVPVDCYYGTCDHKRSPRSSKCPNVDAQRDGWIAS